VRLALVLCLAIHVWLISAGHWGFWPQFTARYDLLARGFAAGQTNLPVRTNARHLALPDPYDPVANSAFRHKPGIPDSCLYAGKFYIYWGPAPSLLLMPFKAVLGEKFLIGDQYVCFAFVQGMLVATAALLLRVRSRHFPDGPVWLPGLGVLLAGLTTPITCILTRSAVYEAAIVGGQCFLLAGIYFAWRGMSSIREDAASRLPLATLFTGGACLTLAVGCRVSLAIAVTAVAAMVTLSLLRGAKDDRRRMLLAIAIFSIPLIAGALGLAWYNKTRFGAWTDFGQKYQLANVNLRSYPTLFGMDCLWPGLWSYLLRPIALVPHFPFFLAVKGDGTFPAAITLPPNYESYEPITGLVWVMPIFWLLPVAATMLIRGRVRLAPSSGTPGEGWGGGSRDSIGLTESAPVARPPSLTLPRSTGGGNEVGVCWLVVALLFAAVLGFLPVLLMIGSAQRYLADLTPPLVIVAMIALWQMTDLRRVTPATARRTFAVVIPLAAISILVGVLISIEGYGGHFRFFNPELFERLSGRHIPIAPEPSADLATTNTH
jgi:hypothetical protein